MATAEPAGNSAEDQPAWHDQFRCEAGAQSPPRGFWWDIRWMLQAASASALRRGRGIHEGWHGFSADEEAGDVGANGGDRADGGQSGRISEGCAGAGWATRRGVLCGGS